MTDNNTLPFSLLEDDEFISLFYDGRNNVNSVRNTVFDNIATNVITNNLDELKLEFNTHDETGHIESSPYYTEASFKQHAETLGKDELFFLHLNIRSANRNFEKLCLFLEYTELQTAPIIALSETWFTTLLIYRPRAQWLAYPIIQCRYEQQNEQSRRWRGYLYTMLIRLCDKGRDESNERCYRIFIC